MVRRFQSRGIFAAVARLRLATLPIDSCRPVACPPAWSSAAHEFVPDSPHVPPPHCPPGGRHRPRADARRVQQRAGAHGMDPPRGDDQRRHHGGVGGPRAAPCRIRRRGSSRGRRDSPGSTARSPEHHLVHAEDAEGPASTARAGVAARGDAQRADRHVPARCARCAPRGVRRPGEALERQGVRRNDPFYPFQSWHYGLIDLPRAWSITTGGASVLVALVDDGTRFDHPALAPNLTSDGYDFVTDADTLPLCAGGTITNADDGTGYDTDPTIPASYSLDPTETCYGPDELGAHGVHVAGTMGAVGNDGIGVTGVNWTVRIRPVRALGVGGFGETYDIAQGILYAAGLPADDGAGGTVQASSAAKIINLSLGGPDDDPMMHSAIVSATSAGALVVAAAGNEGTSALHYPAAYPEVLAVAAVGPDAAPAAYSSFGSYVGIRAPGGNFDLGDATDG